MKNNVLLVLSVLLLSIQGIAQTEIIPKTKVDLQSPTGVSLFQNTSTNGIWATGTITADRWGVFEDATSTKERLTILPGGNVGIGTVNPQSKLHVEGQGSFGKGGVLTVDWTNETNWGGSAYKWAGYIGFNAHRSNEDAKDHYYGTNKYTSKGVFEGSNHGFRWLYRSQNNNDSEGQHQLNEYMRLTHNGNLGIGTTSPQAQLVVGNNFGASISGASGGNAIFGTNLAIGQGGNNHNKLYTPYTHNNNYGYAGVRTSWGRIYFYAEKQNTSANHEVTPTPKMIINELGYVGIGTIDTKGYKLGVKGKIAAEEVKVALYNSWPDYVFEKEYKLPSLKEVENHIAEKGHLQNIPSAKEVNENGIHLGEMNAKLLQKIEELTLYMIEQNKKTELLLKEVTSLKKKNAELEKKIN